MRGTATAANSPRDIMLGLVEPIDPIHSEIASKSKPRQTDSLGPSLAWTLMTHRSLLPGGTQRRRRWTTGPVYRTHFPHTPPPNDLQCPETQSIPARCRHTCERRRFESSHSARNVRPFSLD